MKANNITTITTTTTPIQNSDLEACSNMLYYTTNTGALYDNSSVQLNNDDICSELQEEGTVSTTWTRCPIETFWIVSVLTFCVTLFVGIMNNNMFEEQFDARHAIFLIFSVFTIIAVALAYVDTRFKMNVRHNRLKNIAAYLTVISSCKNTHPDFTLYIEYLEAIVVSENQSIVVVISK